jgi:putative endonuclease
VKAAAAYVYILTNKRNGTLYVGVTNNLVRRVYEHRSGEVPGFTKEHALHRLVWFEPFASIELAIAREKLLKKWRREWKLNLIERDNPDWHELYDGLV